MGSVKWSTAEIATLRQCLQVRPRMRDTDVAGAVSAAHGIRRTPAACCSKARDIGLRLRWSAASWRNHAPVEPSPES
jgi:hypothetical protein